MATPKRTPKRSNKKGSTSLSKKAGTVMPAARIGGMLRRARYTPRVSPAAGVYVAAVTSYLVGELLEAASKGVVSQGSKRITPRALNLAIRHDADLGALLNDVTLSRAGVVPNVAKALERKAGGKKSKKAGKKAKKGGKK